MQQGIDNRSGTIAPESPDAERSLDEPQLVARHAGSTAMLLDAEWADALERAFLAGEGCEPLDAGGRGGVARLECGEQAAIVRRCRRGGLVRHFLHDRYILINRPLREFNVHWNVYRAGIPVPKPLGVMWRRTGPFVEGALATLAIEGVHLRAYLRRHPKPAASTPVVHEAGAQIRRMHEAGVYHADLQLDNIFVSGEAIYMLDFDRAHIVRKLPYWRRTANLLRLRRSMQKHGLAEPHFAELLEGYGPIRFPGWQRRWYGWKAALSDVIGGGKRGHVQ